MKEELKKELGNLYEEEKKFSFIKEKSFSSQEEFDQFFLEHKPQFERLKIIKSRIREVKSLLMTSKEKLEREEYLRKLKDKFSDDSI